MTAEYDVFITPELLEKVYLLQYVNRDRNKGYNARSAACPTEVRIKPESGYLEVDVDMNTNRNFNKYKGLQWGDAMGNARNIGSATFGPASGLLPVTRGARVAGVPRAAKDDVSRENDLQNKLVDFTESVNKNYVHHIQTLGGQILPASEGISAPQYMLGAFRNNQLHLTKVDGIVQMRPQFHHVDAESQRARHAVARDEPMTNRLPQAPKQVMQSYTEHKVEKKPEDITRDLLRTAQDEAWVKLQYHDEDESAAYAAYNEKLFVRDTEAAPHLKSSMTNDEYLDAISAPRNDPGGKKKKRPPRRRATEAENADDEMEEVATAEDDAA